MQRIIVTGANGAGKTWLAARMSQMLGLPWVNNDALALGQNWAYRPTSDIHAAQAKAVAKPAWILDGGPSLVRDGIVARADLIVWLDPPRHLRLGRIIRRTLWFMGRTRPEHPDGNTEWPGRRQIGFMIKAWRVDAQVRAHLDQLTLHDIPFVRLRSRGDVAEFMAKIARRGE